MVNLDALLAGTNIDILMYEMWYTTRRQAHQDGRVGDVSTVQQWYGNEFLYDTSRGSIRQCLENRTAC